jgi:hypothetical protein
MAGVPAWDTPGTVGGFAAAAPNQALLDYTERQRPLTRALRVHSQATT